MSNAMQETREIVTGKDDMGNKYINQYRVMCELGKGSFGKVSQRLHVHQVVCATHASSTHFVRTSRALRAHLARAQPVFCLKQVKLCFDSFNKRPYAIKIVKKGNLRSSKIGARASAIKRISPRAARPPK